MPVLWSNPTPGPTPAELQHGFQIHAAPIAGVLDSIMRQREQQQKQIQETGQGVAKGIAGYMNQQKQDQIAQTLLDKESNYDNPNPTDLESMARTLNESSARPAQAWAAFDKEKSDHIKELLAGSKIEAETARKDYWLNHGQSTGRTSTAKPDTLDKALQPYGATRDDLNAFVESGSPVEFRDKDGTVIKMDQADQRSKAIMRVGDKTFEIPHAKYQQIRNLYQNSLGSNPAPASAAAAPVGSEPSAITSQNEVTRTTKDGKRAIFDSTTQQFLRWADGG